MTSVFHHRSYKTYKKLIYIFFDLIYFINVIILFMAYKYRKLTQNNRMESTVIQKVKLQTVWKWNIQKKMYK